MAPADESSDDLSVTLDWPVDPLTGESASDESARGNVEADGTLDARLAAIESTIGAALDEGTAAALETVAGRLDQLTAEVVGVLRSLNDSVRDIRAELRKDIAAMVEKNTSRRTIFGDELAAELTAWRKKFPTKGPTGAPISEPLMEELVSRLADEVEIRLFAALKKSGALKKSSSLKAAAVKKPTLRKG
jgi:hypothetical protein